MALNELNEKVARLCGWKYKRIEKSADGHDIYESLWVRGEPTMDYENIQHSGDFRIILPDYCNDLNACAEFEKTLTGWQPTNYKDHLWKIVGEDVFSWVTATAEQRCRAFIAVMEGSMTHKTGVSSATLDAARATQKREVIL